MTIYGKGCISNYRNCSLSYVWYSVLYRMLTIKMQLKKKRGSIVCYDTPFFNLSEFYQVAMIILLPE